MAGLSWFELDVDFHAHPKTVALQVALKNPTAEAYVSRLWAYCYHHAVDRFEGAAAVATIEQATHWRGKPGQLVRVLVEVGFLEHAGDALVAHGVADRLGPHLKAKKNDAIRQRRRRDKALQETERHGHVTRDITRDDRGTSALYRDRDRDRDRDTSVDRQTDGTELAAGGWLAESEGFRERLGQGVGLGHPVGIGKDPTAVAAEFGRWIAAVGEARTLDECVNIAASKQVQPHNLAWWVGWLATVPDAQLRAGSGAGGAA